LKKKQDLAVLQTNGSGVLSFAGVSASAGQVIQVVTATDATERSTSSTSFVTASNTLSASITPSSASNRILILLNVTALVSGTGAQRSIIGTIYRNATNISGAEGLGRIRWKFDPDSYNVDSNLTIMHIDSPSSTSALTYQLYIRRNDDNCSVVLNPQNSTSSIILMEIKG